MLKITLFLCATILLVTSNVTAQNSKPDSILIYIDDMDYGDIGITGANEYQTLNFNQLQMEGVFFTQFYSPQTVCKAPGSGLLSGTYPKRIGFSGALGNLSKIGLSQVENRRQARYNKKSEISK